MCCWETMESYIKNNPKEFSPIKVKLAKIKGFQLWEGVAESSANGTNKDASTPSLQMVMRNKYGWDKDESKSNQSTHYTVNVNPKLAAGVPAETLSRTANRSTE